MRLRAGAATLFLTLALSGAAAGATEFGVSDDYGKYADDGGAWFFSEMSAVGLTVNKMTVNWDPKRPDTIADKPFLDRAIDEASRRGIRVTLGVHIGKARAITGSRGAVDRFCSFLELLVETYPELNEIVVGNEPNLTRFWQPQFNSKGRGVSGMAFAGLLARAYDTLKAANPNITVVGVGLSPRGNDLPKARSNVSTSPVKFIRDLGRGYRAMARAKPIMDVFGFHPYPGRDRDSLAKGYRWPNAGVANLNRIKQAVWDAFHGTGQPTFPEGVVEQPAEPEPPVEPPAPPAPEPPAPPAPAEPPPAPTEPPPAPTEPPPAPTEPPLDPPAPPVEPPVPPPAEPPVPVEPPVEEEPEPPPPLTFKLDEVGWQVAVPRRALGAYHGKESVRPTNERTQAQIYGSVVRRLACDPAVREVLFFGLIDEPNLDRWQAGLVRADRTRRASYGTVRSALAETGGRCLGRQVVWRHTERVIGAKAKLVRGKKVRLYAEEDATVRVAGRAFRLRAYRPLRVRVAGRPVVRFFAAMNTRRSTTIRP
jgi:hypothetical protein